ncbi:hypothetical protein [Amycolatopsis jiangsuensis]|uniref:Type IV secretory pathway VirB10-like protein n=1 Tax=Amycolatopsis jiangsuensis TaxID=1181879 RepID=A0A840IZM5_9PSEU|nr:hypothetical protein [Amycolatopsis jiangsuensis]MBB4686959.1 type IV secretory pathway VirB10-like protein [Amycolatopsis jiangsuensis]
MLRLVESRPAGSRPATELADRTGIIAASVPRSRQSPEEAGEESSCEETRPIPVVTGLHTAESAVAVRRRRRSWATGSVALALIALGWLGGGLVAGGVLGHEQDDAVAEADQRVVTAPPPPQHQSPPPAPPKAAAPVTVYVPVPAHDEPTSKHATVRPTTPRASAPSERSDQDEARADAPKPAPATSAAPKKDFRQYVEQQWQPWTELAQKMSGLR